MQAGDELPVLGAEQPGEKSAELPCQLSLQFLPVQLVNIAVSHGVHLSADGNKICCLRFKPAQC